MSTGSYLYSEILFLPFPPSAHISLAALIRDISSGCFCKAINCFCSQIVPLHVFFYFFPLFLEIEKGVDVLITNFEDIIGWDGQL